MATGKRDFRSALRALKHKVAERFGLDRLRRAVLDRRVAESPWYHGDGAALLLLLGVQILTGLAMVPSYSSSIQEAHESVAFFTQERPLGGFVRALHYWSGGLMVVMVVVHLFRQILVGGYKAPREGTWTIGVGLLFLVLVMSFSGYVLRWDERAIYAVHVLLSMLLYLPWAGEALARFVIGGAEIGAETLTRFFAVHVIFVPLVLLLLVAHHLYLVIVHGVTSRAEKIVPVETAEQHERLYERVKESEELGEAFRPETMLKTGLLAFGVFAFAFALAWLAGPPELGPEANRVDPAFPAEEWWFWWYSALIALLPSRIAPAFMVLFPLLVFLGLLILPLLDRGPNRGIRNRPIWAAVVLVLAISLLALSGLRQRSPWTGWPDPTAPPWPVSITVTPELEEGRRLFVQYGCNSCHPVAGHGWRVGPDLTTLPRLLSREEMRQFILRPPEGAAMPGYQGRMTEEELERVVDYCHVLQILPRRP
jgi:ubiquinol-cytochrome c reductase cytochrome b subunit